MEHRPRLLWLGAPPIPQGLPGQDQTVPWPDVVDVEFLESPAGVKERLTTGRFDVLVVSLGAGHTDRSVISDARAMYPGLPVVACLEDDDEAGFQAALQAGAQECLGRGELAGERVLRIAGSAMIRQRCEDEQRKRDAQINQAVKMEALEQLAGGVAHDFNNLITSVLGFSRFAYDALPERHPVRDDLREIMAAGDRAAEITRELLTFARRGMMQQKPVDVNTVVAGMQPALARLLGGEVSLEFTPAKEPAMIRGDSAAIEEMFMILAANARDAMSAGGTFSIIIQQSGPEVASDGGAPSVKITVRDTGCGMKPAVVAHVFEPFFSTKIEHKATGLGLSIVYGIVEHQDGRIEVSSIPGKGTDFVITFPAMTEGSALDLGDRGGMGTANAGRILLVEDEEAVRKFAARVLRGAGYDVIEAEDGQAGLDACRHCHRAVDLIFTDVVMPRLHGPEMVMTLRREGVDCGVLYATGYSQQSITRLGMEDARGPVMLKPYTQQTMLSKVREVLESVAVQKKTPAG